MPTWATCQTTLDQEIRCQENQQAMSWHTRSQIQWLTRGEAPNKYFFAQLCAWQTRDNLLDIQLSNVESATTNLLKKQAINQHYKDLYTTNLVVFSNSVERLQILFLLTHRNIESKLETTQPFRLSRPNRRILKWYLVFNSTKLLVLMELLLR